KKKGIVIDVPAQGHMRNLKIREDLVVKLVPAQQELMHTRQKRSRLSSLDDPVIVSTGNRDGLADSELRQDRWSNGLIFSGVFDRSGGNNHRLARHQARSRSHGANRPRVRQR